MIRLLVACCSALILAGCGRADTPLQPPLSIDAPQGLIINGFNEADTVILREQWYRVGGYYDFSPYNHLTIQFTARHLTLTSATDLITVRIGPAMYLTDSVSSAERNISLWVSTAELSKPHMSALTFINPNPDAPLRLSGLRVMGWMTEQ